MANVAFVQSLLFQRTPLKEADVTVSTAPLDEEEGDTCAICFEQWTNAGAHRLSALRCGHLFGYTCIVRWLKGQAGKCPQVKCTFVFWERLAFRQPLAQMWLQ